MVHLETRRKTLHMLSGIFFATAVQMLSMEWAFVMLGACALLTLGISLGIVRGLRIPFFTWLVQKTEREGRKPGTGVKWFFVGALTIMVGTLLMHTAKEFIVASMLIVAIGDGLSTGLGRKIGKHRLPRTQTKSVEGSFIGFGVAFFAAALVIRALFPISSAMLIAGAGAFAGMITEAYLRKVDDNVSIPIASWLAMVAALELLSFL